MGRRMLIKNKMKSTVLILSLIFPLSACEKVKETILDKIEEKMPDLEASEQQNTKAKILFQALIDHDQAKILSLSEQDIRDELTKNPQIWQTVFDALPDYVADNPELVLTAKSIETTYGKVTKIGYKYIYPNQTIIFSVVFDGHDGGDKIVGFWVQEVEK